MLQRVDLAASDANLPAFGHGSSSPAGADLTKIVAFIKASARIVICWTIAVMALTLLYALTAVPEYTAVANLVLDAHKVQVFKDAPVVNDAAVDAAQIESQVEIIRSETVARSVVRNLKLSEDPEFVGGQPRIWTILLRTAFGGGDAAEPSSEEERDRKAVRTLRDNLSVRRLGVTYILEVSYRSIDPDKAARIANAVVDAYVVDQLQTKFEATKRASVWLQERIQELRSQSSAAARAVQEFKAKNNLVDMGNRGLVSDQQLQEINSQLIIASSHTAEMLARLERVTDVLKAPAPDEAFGTVSDALTNPVILRLRQQYLDTRKREAEFSAKYGRMHLAAVSARNEMLELQRSIVNELTRIADSYRSDYEIAKTREDSIRASLQRLVKEADTTGQAQVSLKSLENSANTYQVILENFLQKYTEAVQQQSFPISDSRLITSAEPPTSKSFPKTILLALLGMIAGVSCGVGHSLVIRALDRTIGAPREFKELFGIECLSLIPILPRLQPQSREIKQVDPAAMVGTAVREDTERSSVSSLFVRSDSVMQRSVLDPLSRFTESLRSVKTSIDLAGIALPLKVIGILSSLPGEGKSTVAANLANLFASGGSKTLLIDGDLRNPTLTRTLAPYAVRGLLQLIQNTARLDEVLWSDPETGLKFLPTVTGHRVTNSADLLGSDRTRAVLKSLSEYFEYIIIDLPPLGAAVDGRAISPQIDGFIMVVEWRKTRRDVVSEALTSMGGAREKIVGGVLNKVNYRELNNVDGYSPGYYLNNAYGRYGGSSEN
jgi:polysaccharide biosynthesis transport protein